MTVVNIIVIIVNTDLDVYKMLNRPEMGEYRLGYGLYYSWQDLFLFILVTY